MTNLAAFRQCGRCSDLNGRSFVRALFICERLYIGRIGPLFGTIGNGNGSSQQLITLSTHTHEQCFIKDRVSAMGPAKLSSAPASIAKRALLFSNACFVDAQRAAHHTDGTIPYRLTFNPGEPLVPDLDRERFYEAARRPYRWMVGTMTPNAFLQQLMSSFASTLPAERLEIP